MYRLALIVLTFLVTLAPTDASAEQGKSQLPRGSYIVTPGAKTMPRFSRGQPPLLVYLNRDGGTYTCGPNNSSVNTSSILCNGNEGTVSPSTLSDEDWATVVRCVTIQFGRFGLIITDQDPGATQHVEAVVAGFPNELGFTGAGGVAPFTCGVIDRAIVYTFQGVYANNTTAICETTAQEVAHAFGLDHELLCEDPMTYLNGCGEKSFQDVFASCGEGAPRACGCPFNNPATSQNSVRQMLTLFGGGETIPPTVSIISPIDGAEVDPTFRIAVDATDNTLVNYVEFWIDGELRRTIKLPPYEYTASLSVTQHTIIAKAFDQAFNEATATTNITVLPQCATDPDCGGTLVCRESLCVGGFGTPCQTQAECDDMLSCAEEDGENLCTMSCIPGNSSCPGGFTCLEGEFGAAKCWPGSGGKTCGCQVGTRGAGTLASLLLLLACFATLIAIRRRRSPR